MSSDLLESARLELSRVKGGIVVSYDEEVKDEARRYRSCENGCSRFMLDEVKLVKTESCVESGKEEGGRRDWLKISRKQGLLYDLDGWSSGELAADVLDHLTNLLQNLRLFHEILLSFFRVRNTRLQMRLHY